MTASGATRAPRYGSRRRLKGVEHVRDQNRPDDELQKRTHDKETDDPGDNHEREQKPLVDIHAKRLQGVLIRITYPQLTYLSPDPGPHRP
jgi:hypothetical protein